MSLTKLLPTAEQFNALKVRAIEYEEQGFPDCYPPMVNSIKFFNKHPGIAPLFCSPGLLGGILGLEFYLNFALTEEGFEFLSEFAGRFFELLTAPTITRWNIVSDVKKKYDPSDSSGNRGRKLSDEEKAEIDSIAPEVYTSVYDKRLSFSTNLFHNTETGKDEYMPRVTLGVSCRTKEEKEFVHKIFEQTMAEFEDRYPHEKADITVGEFSLPKGVELCYLRDVSFRFGRHCVEYASSIVKFSLYAVPLGKELTEGHLIVSDALNLTMGNVRIYRELFLHAGNRMVLKMNRPDLKARIDILDKTLGLISYQFEAPLVDAATLNTKNKQ